MMRISCLIIISLIGLSAKAGITKKSNPQLYSLRIETNVSHTGSGISETDLFLGYMKHNNYQYAIQASHEGRARILRFGLAGDSCLYYKLRLGRNTEHGIQTDLYSRFLLAVYDITTDFSQIDTIYPYDTERTEYLQYTGSDKPYIDVFNEELLSVSNQLWSESPDVLNYSRKAFDYVATHFEYMDKESGFRSLEKILNLGGSDCGNLSSVFITLLRMKGIPARHIMGFRPDGSLHVWAEFYLENYGWIPADVTYAVVKTEGDYFGHIKFTNNGFIVHRGIGNLVEFNHTLRRISGLQTYSYQTRYSDEKNAEVIVRREVICKKLSKWNSLEIAGFQLN